MSVDPRIAAGMSEDDLQDSIRQLCVAHGHLYYHTRDSRNSPEGFPDATLVVRECLILRELKTMKGHATPAQLRWLDALSRVTRIESGIWRPDAWCDGTIERRCR